MSSASQVNIQDSPENPPAGEVGDSTNENDSVQEKSADSCENNEGMDTSADGNSNGHDEKNLFTSEIFKIEIRNMPKFYGIAQLRKLLGETLKLGVRKIKTVGKFARWVYVCFDSKEEQLKAIQVLNNYKWKGCSLYAMEAAPAPDPMKRKFEDNDEKPAKKPKIETMEQLMEVVEQQVIPWSKMDYKEQLQNKTKDVRSILMRFGRLVQVYNPKSVKYVESQQAANDGLPCKLFECRGIDNVECHRNKCEFTIGKNSITGEKTVGFRLGTYASGTVEVGPITGLKHISPRMARAVESFEKFIRNSPYDCFDPRTHEGQWGQLTVRTGSGQLMLIVGIHAMNCTHEIVNKIKDSLMEFFSCGEGQSLSVTSLYLQMLVRRQPGASWPKPELLQGKPCIEETLCGLKFKISPESFFQVNTPCIELLINSIKELAKVDKNTTVLDVCCGTGTLGMCFAKDCGQVIGIEKFQGAVDDANENAKNNNLENCQFFCGLADQIITSAVNHSKNERIVAIVDPPRAGLHPRSIKQIRKTEKIQSIVFLSCDARLAHQNFLDLCKGESKTVVGPPFYLVSAVPVDMFPYTNRSELILYFERETVLNFEF